MQFENVTCPHCGILCDDLSIEVSESSVTPLNLPYDYCNKAYKQASIKSSNLPSPQIQGEDVSLQDAIEKAVEILKNSSQPLISGLIADVQACREAVALTEKVSGVIDHANGPGIRPNIAVMQRLGKVKTTLSEARNRADHIIIFGSDVLNRFPRLMERVLAPGKSLGPESTINKNITIIDSLAQAEDKSLAGKNINYLRLDAPDLESIIQKLELIVHSNVEADENDTVTQALLSLHQQILDSQYTVLIWSTSLLNIVSAEQTIQSITQSIKTLMQKVRCVGLPLGGSKGEITASQVSTWQTGVPLPVAFMGGTPVHEPLLYNGVTMLENNEADSLVWLSTYSSEDVPPKTDIPKIVIGHPGMKLENDTAVFIPVGIPGIDTRGLACRTDSVATLPLLKIRNNELPVASDVLNKIIKML